MENNDPETTIYSAGYADTFQGSSDFSTEYSCFYEKEPDGTVGASNLYVLASGVKGTSFPEVSARFTAKKILYEYFHSYDYVDANKLALAMRTANNEIYEYAKVQNDTMAATAIAASVTDGKVAIANVGGSRAYIIRNGKVFQITEDPAVVDEKVQSGELSEEEAYGPEGKPVDIAAVLGTAKDITTDVYDGIEVRSGDILLLCSASLDTFIGKQEILAAAADNAPRTIVQQLLSSPSLQNANVPASVAAIRIYDENSVDSMIRVDGDTPENTDLNLEKKEIELIRKNRPRTPGENDGDKTKKKDRLPLIILLVLLALMLLAGGIIVMLMTIGEQVALVVIGHAARDAVDEIVAVAIGTVGKADGQAAADGTMARCCLRLHPFQGGVVRFLGSYAHRFCGKPRTPHLGQHVKLALLTLGKQLPGLANVLVGLCPADVRLQKGYFQYSSSWVDV